jgi:hypothetical protein
MIQDESPKKNTRNKKKMSVYLQKEKPSNIKFKIESFEVRECTYLLFGDEELNQPMYNCSTCDPNRTERMCKECYERCHTNCKKDPKYKSYLGMDSFVCECGKVSKHYIATINANVNLSKCKFRSIDKKINNNYMYKCGEDDKVVCSICYHECHSGCDPNKKTSTKIQEVDDECQCTNDNHSALNEFTFSIKPEEYTQECGLPKLWPVQMLNILFCSDRIYDEMANYIHKNLCELTLEVRFANIVSLLSGIFNSNFKTYYYHPNIMNLFPYEKFVEFLYKFKARNTDEMLLKMRMIFILLFVHVKKDFNLIKTFSISDFMTSTILERLLYKDFILSSNIYTREIHEKYKINTEDFGDVNIEMESENITARDISLKRITTKVGNLLAKAIKKCDLVTHQKEFSICLKLISFMLKRMVFTTRELNKLIKSLFNFNNEFISMLIEEGRDGLNPKVDLLIPTFSYLAKIFYLIGINYNDIIFKNSVGDPREDYKNRYLNFIQTFSESPGKLFKMIVKNCSIITDYYNKIDRERANESGSGGYNRNHSLSTKVVRIFNEALKLFCLADNNYYDQIQKITSVDLKIFDLRREQLKAQLILKTLEKCDISESHRDHEQPLAEKAVLFEFKKKIEITLDEFFTYKNITDTNERLIANIKEYSLKSMTKIYGMGKTIRQESQDSFILDKSVELSRYYHDDKKKSEDYVSKLLGVIKEHFPFVLKDSFKESIDLFIDEMIFSAIDETISKFLFFFCQYATGDENILPDIEIDIVLTFLSLFCLNKAGIKHFCSGKNLIRIIKIFNQYPKRVLQFFYLIFKGLNLYKVEISNHKILKVMKKDFIDYLRQFKVNDSNIKDFEVQLVLIMKIFFITSDNYEFEDYENIKKEIIDIMRINGFLDKEKFKKVFEINYEQEKLNLEEQKKKSKTILVNEDVVIMGNTPDKNSDKMSDNLMNDIDEKIDLLIVRENSSKENIITPGEKISHKKTQSQMNLLMGEESKSVESEVRLTKKQVAPISKQYSNNNLNDRSILDKYIEVDMPESKILYKLYFSFFALINKNTYYCFNEPEELQSLQDILNFNDLIYIRIILSKRDMISLAGRRTLLQFLRTYYFIDILSRDDINKRQGYLTNKEYHTYFTNTLKRGMKISTEQGEMEKYPTSINYQSPEEEHEIKRKFEFIQQIITVIDIFTQEIGSFDKFLRKDKDVQNIEDYVKELTLSVKFISDFIFNENIWNNVTISYYKLAKEFIVKSHVIKSVLVNITKDKSVGKLPKIDREANESLKEMENSEFDIFDKKRIYDILLVTFTDIFSSTDIDKKFRLQTYLDKFDNIAELNFTPFALIETKDYEYFYEKEEEEKLTDKDEIRLKDVRDSFNKQFIDIRNTTFMNVIQSISGEAELIDFRINIVQYFVSYINSDVKHHTHNYTYTLLCIITKMMFYDTDETQNKLSFLLNSSYDEFFQKFNAKLQTVFVMNFATAKNFFQAQRYLGITNVNKLIIQFLQLLAEGFNTNYHDRIFKSFSDDLNFTFFDNIVSNLVSGFNRMNVEYFANGELTFDKLLVLMTNIVDFMVEYAQQEFSEVTEEKEDEDDVSQGKVLKYIKLLFTKKIHKILFLNLNSSDNETFPNRKKILCYLKIKFISLIIAFTQNKVNNIKFILREYNPPTLFEEIIFNFNDLITAFIKKKKLPKDIYEYHHSNFLTLMTDLYIYDEDFRDSLQLTLCFKIYQLIKIFSDVYGLKSIKTHFEDIDLEAQEEQGRMKKEENSRNKKMDLSFNSPLAYKIFLFLEAVVVKVVIRDSEGRDCPTFFVRPSLTFHLTKQTMSSFLDNVPRETTFSKLNSLIEESDYFVFEMVCNSHYKQGDIMNKLLQNLQFVYIETLNYLFIIINQILMLVHFYKDVSLPDETYESIDSSMKLKVYEDVLIVSLIQLSLLFIILLLWYMYKFPLYFQHNLMSLFRRNFIFKTESKGKETGSNKTVQKIFSEEDISPMKMVKDLNSDVGFWTKFKVGLFDSVMMNREVNTLFFSFVLTLTYLLVGSPIILVLPSLLVANLSPILYDIFVAIRLRWRQLLTVLVFTYLVIYLFMWITLLWINDIFKFDDTKIPGKV